jgi:hypothetical protein
LATTLCGVSIQIKRATSRHSSRVGREDRALIDDPAGARVSFAEFFQYLNVSRQVDLGAAYGARNQQLEKTGGGQSLKKPPRQLPIRLDLIGVGSDGGGQLLRGVERRSSPSGSHGVRVTSVIKGCPFETRSKEALTER